MQARCETGAMNGRMRAAYDVVAAEYAANNAEMYPELVEYGGYLLAHVDTGGRVLDLGCGPGRDAAWFAANGANVTGADLSRGMLSLAYATARRPFVQLDMRRLAFRGGAFAGVWCMASLLHIPKADAPGVLREIRRVLAPGGALALGLQRGDSEGWEDAPLRERHALLRPLYARRGRSVARIGRLRGAATRRIGGARAAVVAVFRGAGGGIGGAARHYP